MTVSARYLFSIFGSLGLLFFLWLAAFYAQLGLPTSTSQWATDLFEQKTLAANRIKGPRLFILGGSGVHFSVSAEKISKTIGIPTINFGTYAGLEAEYFIYKIKKILRADDIVLLPLEYSYYTDRPKDSYSYIDHLLARDPAFFSSSFPLIEQLKIAFSLPWSRLKQPFKEKFFPKTKKPTTLIYYRVYPNSYGDTHVTNRVFLTNHIRALRENSAVDSGLFTISDKSNIWNELDSFAKWCKERNISLLATAPNHQYFENIDNDLSQTTIKKIKDFYSNIGVPFLGDPFKVMFERSFYFDTSYHMNELGKALYTDYLISILRNNIKQIQDRSGEVETSFVAKDNPVEKILSKFNGWEPIEGLKSISDSVLLKGLTTLSGGSKIVLQVQVVKKSEMILAAEIKSSLDKEKISIYLDGKPWRQDEPLSQENFNKMSIPILVSKGKHLITIEAKKNISDSKKSALFFKSLTITSKGELA